MKLFSGDSTAAVRCVLIALPILISLFHISPAYSESRVGMRVGGERLSASVTSLAELRWKSLVRQGWDISCGAAALSTLLTYHHQRPFSEMAVTLTILKNSDPVLVRQRGGFSLYDLKRFVRAVGLDGIGYGEMTLEDLVHFNIPAILPIRINNLDHFVIYRNTIGGHVFLGDPAFGNISLSAKRFEAMWSSRVAFYVATEAEKEGMAKLQSNKARSPLSPTAMEMAVSDLGYISRLVSRIQTTPLTRRIARVKP